MAHDSEPPDFEQALAELEQLVETLEHGDLPLDEALRRFERGVELTRHCQGALKAAHQRVEILLRRNGEPAAAPFEATLEAPEDTGGRTGAQASAPPSPSPGHPAREPAKF
jgi:exodeoxyribonuclease VII small subunit